MDYKLIDIIDVIALQSLFDSFYLATGMLTAIVDLEGNIVTASGWEEICTKFHRVHPVACERCIESDVQLATQMQKGDHYTIYRCKNGLIDIAVPIIIEDIHIGNLFTGQLLFEEPDQAFFINQAQIFNFDEQAYLAALQKVKVYSEEQIKQTLDFLTKLSAMIANLGIAKKQQLKINEEITVLLNNKVQLNEELMTEKIKLEQIKEKLEKSNQELDDFAYIASHDLREPLRGINNYSAFLIEDYAALLDEDGEHMLLSISRLAARLDQFISSLLYYSRLGRTMIGLKQISLKAVIDEVVESYEIAINERPTRINILKNQPIIYSDRQKIIEIYKNLISNALKYNQNPERQIEIGYLYPGERNNEPVLYVKDNGIGIKETDFDKVFTIFKRLHPKDKYGGGTGAGLTIVKKCLDMLNGKIWIESKIGVGTTFFFAVTGGNREADAQEDEDGKRSE